MRSSGRRSRVARAASTSSRETRKLRELVEATTTSASPPRVEAGRDPEEVPRRVVIATTINGALSLAQRLGGPLLQARARDVELCSVAGREADRLPLVAGELAREVPRLVGIERNALANLERRSAVRDADERELSQQEPPRDGPPRR